MSTNITNSKIALLGDVHCGAHSSDVDFHDYMAASFSDFFDYLKTNNIKQVIQLGDLFDVRKHLTTYSINWFKQHVIKPTIDSDIHWYVLIGNHDIYYRESLKLSSVKELLEEYSQWFTVIDKPENWLINGDTEFLLVPWVCRENSEDVTTAIKRSISKYCCGHFEFDGFELYKGHQAKSHMTHSEYSKFNTVFSGHYHYKSTKDNILYTGTPYQLTWVDCNTEKGFHVLDTQTDELEFVRNHRTIYSMIKLSELQNINAINPDDVTKKHVRIVIDVEISSKEDIKLKDLIASMKPLTIKYIDQIPSKDDNKQDQFVQHDAVSSVPNIIKDYVRNQSTLPSIVRTSELEDILLKLYQEAEGAS